MPLLIFMIGTCFGSFISCMSYRYITHESILGGLFSKGKSIHVIWVSSLLLIISFFIMGLEKLRE